MVVQSPMILAIYASSAVTTALNIGLIIYQHRRMRNIFIRVVDIRAHLRDIERRLPALEEKHRLKIAA